MSVLMGRVFPHLTQATSRHQLGILESESESRSFLSDSLWPLGLYSPWNSPGQNIGVGPFPSPGHLPNPGTEPKSPTLQVDEIQPNSDTTQRQQQISQVKGSVLQEHLILQTPIASPGCYLCFWQAGYKLEVPWPVSWDFRLQSQVLYF